MRGAHRDLVPKIFDVSRTILPAVKPVVSSSQRGKKLSARARGFFLRSIFSGRIDLHRRHPIGFLQMNVATMPGLVATDGSALVSRFQKFNPTARTSP